MVRVFINDQGDLGSIPSWVIPKAQKIIRQGSRVKWSNPGERVAPSPTPWCSSYWKRGLWVTLDYGLQLYFIYLPIKLLLRFLISNRMQGEFAGMEVGNIKSGPTGSLEWGGLRLKDSKTTGTQEKHHWWSILAQWRLVWNQIVGHSIDKANFT